MSIDSLDDLKGAFKDWRQSKKRMSERIASVLLRRARRAVAVHGKRRVTLLP